MNDISKHAQVTRRAALKTLGVSTALATTSVAGPANVRRARAADPIRVGVISPLTGAWTVYGRWLLDKSRPYIYKLHGSRLTRINSRAGRPLAAC